MNISEFETKINAIYNALFDYEVIYNDDSFFGTVNQYSDFITDRKNRFFSSFEENKDQIIFILNSRVADLFMVNKNEMVNEDPIVNIYEKGNWVSFEFHLSTLLISEYTDWLSKQTINKFNIRFEGYRIMVPIKKFWNQLSNPFSYPDKVWIAKDSKSVILIQNEISTIICMAKDQQSLKNAQKQLEQ
ncbi:hypothetical protein AB3466_13195 [Sphingobacterium thalpophilum]|uniref:hypothetical protein n=1 Tax=Sphingobacterium thalpophilum TaxID=259 RepID=UPI0037DA586A